MKTIPIDERMSQIADPAGQEAYEKFVQEGITHCLKERATKERKDKDEKPTESADSHN